MCNFFSGVITKEGKVFWYENLDSHDQIIEKVGLKDLTADPDKMRFARFEITPPHNDAWERDLSKWVFRIDESITPIWFESKYEKSCRKALAECIEKCLIIDDDLAEIENRNGLIIVNSKIKVVKACAVREMWESSEIGVMRESSKIGEMWESSKIGEMRESSKIGAMRGSSKIGEMRESSKIGEMRESSKIGVMWESSEIGVMRESSKIGVMRESSEIGAMWGSSKIGAMRESSKIGVMRESSKIGGMRGSSIAISRKSETIEVIHPADLKIKLTKFKEPKKSNVPMMIHFHAEISEAWEEYRKGKGMNEIYFVNEKPDRHGGKLA
jgi:hypothetical protein